LTNDVVVTLAGRIPELYIAALGTLKAGAISSPFFSAFGPEPIKARRTAPRLRLASSQRSWALTRPGSRPAQMA
jgi:acetyl-CoA synthetase